MKVLPNIVKNKTLSVVEAGPDLPLLPSDQVAFHLQAKHSQK